MISFIILMIFHWWGSSIFNRETANILFQIEESYRSRLARKQYDGPLCGVCYDYAELTEGSKR